MPPRPQSRPPSSRSRNSSRTLGAPYPERTARRSHASAPASPPVNDMGCASSIPSPHREDMMQSTDPSSPDPNPPRSSSLAAMLQNDDRDETPGQGGARLGDDGQGTGMEGPATLGRDGDGASSSMNPGVALSHGSFPPLGDDSFANMTFTPASGDRPSSDAALVPLNEAHVTHASDAISVADHDGSSRFREARGRGTKAEYVPRPTPASPQSPKVTRTEPSEISWITNIKKFSVMRALSSKQTWSADDNMRTPERRVASLEEDLARERDSKEQLARAKDKQSNEMRSLRISYKELSDELERVTSHARRFEEENYDLRSEVHSQLVKNERLSNEKNRLVMDQKELIRQQKELVGQNDHLRSQVTVLEKEVADLTTRLKSAQSHIFSLQPFRDTLTSKEAESDFTALMANIEAWVDMMVGPFLRDTDKMAALQFGAASSSRAPTKRLRDCIECHRDLFYATAFPETEVDIFVTVVVRILRESVFDTATMGMSPHAHESLELTEYSMSQYAKPSRDLYAIRNWKAETYNAILQHPEFHIQRSYGAMGLRIHIEEVFDIFLKDNPNRGSISSQLYESVILPALALDAKFRTSTDHYYLAQTSYLDWDDATAETPLPVTKPELVEHLPQLLCYDMLRGRKVLSPNPRLMADERRGRLDVVATIAPALQVRRVQSGSGSDSGSEPETVSRQKILVVLGTDEEKRKFSREGRCGILRQLFGLRPWV